MRILSARSAALSTGGLLALAVALGPAACATAPAPPPAPHVVPVPAGIDATGATDVSAPLNAFFHSVPDGSTVELPAGATYRIEAPVLLADKHDLTVEGNGARTITTTTGDRTRQHWQVLRGSGLTIRDLTVVGANPHGGTGVEAYVYSLEAQHGFNLAGVHGITLDHVRVTDVYGDFVYVGADVRAGWSQDVRVVDSTFARNGRQGVSITGGRRVVISHDSFTETRRATFDLEPNGGTTGVDDVTISDNAVGKGRLNFISAVGRGPVNHVTVTGNVLTGRAMNSAIGNDVDHRTDWTITGNRSDTGYGNPGGAVMLFRNVDRIAVTDNVQPVQEGRGMYLVKAAGACTVTVSGNTTRGAVGGLVPGVAAAACAPAAPAPTAVLTAAQTAVPTAAPTAAPAPAPTAVQTIAPAALPTPVLQPTAPAPSPASPAPATATPSGPSAAVLAAEQAARRAAAAQAAARRAAAQRAASQRTAARRSAAARAAARRAAVVRAAAKRAAARRAAAKRAAAHRAAVRRARSGR